MCIFIVGKETLFPEVPEPECGRVIIEIEVQDI